MERLTQGVAGPVRTVVTSALGDGAAVSESVAAIRRNLIAVASVLVSVVIIGAAATWIAGWIALGIYTLLVVSAAVAVRRVNARYAPRHSRYTPRHA